MYKALMDIGDYKKGDIVPDDKAVIWNNMYDVKPTILVDNPNTPIPVKEPPKIVQPREELDINNDGIVDDADKSLAGKVLASKPKLDRRFKRNR